MIFYSCSFLPYSKGPCSSAHPVRVTSTRAFGQILHWPFCRFLSVRQGATIFHSLQIKSEKHRDLLSAINAGMVGAQAIILWLLTRYHFEHGIGIPPEHPNLCSVRWEIPEPTCRKNYKLHCNVDININDETRLNVKQLGTDMFASCKSNTT